MKEAAPSPEASVDTIAYRRVSTEDQAREEKASLSQQLDAIKVLAQRLGRELGHVFEDPGRSGADVEARPGFQAMVRHCQANPRSRRSPGYILVLNDSRWGRFRDPDEAAYWRFLLVRLGWFVRFAEGGESQDPIMGSLLRSVHSVQASTYRENIRTNAKRGARAAAAKGLWQNEAPIGYRRLATGGGKPEQVLEPGQRKASDQVVRLTPGPVNEQEFVRRCFGAYANGGVSLGDLAREGNSRFPGRAWSRPVVSKLLRSRTYLGEVIWCRRPHDRWEREETPIRPVSEWVVKQDAHPALITTELFDAVGRRLRENQKRTRATAGGYPLSGLIHCAHCGEPYTGGGGAKGPPHDPDRYRFYKDRGGVRWYDGQIRPTCPGPLGTLMKRWVEPQVIGAVASVVETPSVQEAIEKALDEAMARVNHHQQDRRRTLHAEKTKAEAARERLVRAVAAGTIREAEAGPELERLRQELARTSAELEVARFDTRRSETVLRERQRLLALARDFRSSVKGVAGHQLRELLSPWIQSAVVDKQKRQLLLKIRHVPSMSLMQSSPQPGRGSR